MPKRGRDLDAAVFPGAGAGQRASRRSLDQPRQDVGGRDRREPGLEMVTNQMSTQVRGEFDAVLSAITDCTRTAMERVQPVVLVAKFLNADLPISTRPTVG